MSIEQIVEEIARLDNSKLQELAIKAMDRGVAVPLEFHLHTAQLDAEMEDANEF